MSITTDQAKSYLNTEGAAVLYWVCLMIGVLMWTIGELTTTSHLREISRDVEELKHMLKRVQQEQAQCFETASDNGQEQSMPDSMPAI
jgi:hypothetical protein